MSILLALAACTDPELASDFTLRVVPDFVEGQDVLGDGPEIKLLLQPPGEAATVTWLGTGSDGAELALPNVGPLAAGTVIGLLSEASGSTDAAWNPSATVAYGQVMLGEDLGLGEQQVELQVLVPLLGELGKLGNLPSSRQRMGGAAAALPDGSVYVFGGGAPSSFDPIASRAVLEMAGRNTGDFSFANAGNIPSFTALDSSIDQPSRAGMSATTIDVEGAPMIFVAGGRGDWISPWDNVDGWFVWDPALAAVNKQGKMGSSRSSHLAIPFANGDVLLWGGLQLDGRLNATHERFDVSELRTRPGQNADRLEILPFKAFGSPLGDDVIICGGYTLGGLATLVWQPTDGCNRFQFDDDVEGFDPLPMPLAGAAMTELPGGRLLLTGGATEPPEDAGYSFGVVPALADAWIHDGGGWRSAGAMGWARAGHRMVSMPDGRVLIVGGNDEATGLYGDMEGPVRCPEVFDPTDESFTELECTNVGQGADPLVAVAPGQGAVVVEGYYSLGTTFVGAAEYGIISLGPPLTPP